MGYCKLAKLLVVDFYSMSESHHSDVVQNTSTFALGGLVGLIKVETAPGPKVIGGIYAMGVVIL